MEHLLMLAILKVKEIAEKLGLIADYVVEQGEVTLGIYYHWKYEKWNSGKVVAKSTMSLGGVVISESYGSGRYKSTTYSYSLPAVFTEVTDARIGGNLGGTWGVVADMSTTYLDAFLVSPYTNSNIASKYFWCITVEGRWK